jgi:hypothetical protein
MTVEDQTATVPAEALDGSPSKLDKVKKAKGTPKKSKSDEPPRKRGPPRPHRKLPQGVLEGRIEKLRKRIERARGQLEDAERHVVGYDKEAKYREQEKKAS